jgi:hypothetical protein
MATKAGCISSLSQLSGADGILNTCNQHIWAIKIHIIFKKHYSNSSLQYMFGQEYLAISS